ncbi:polysaccharide deacetylase family protein [Kutzneria kofuensis]|uniref:Peptidoglycan/xylan/chitin deacetylase (PgdA/CDA1 family) n=1 Tax=Kutzneria kofuensis TaxID=103725 RepID=A0A7W9KIC2_9PSEU|nr:polysaccharide deacetylase family protein [Kutzneria kofuensis]MBB5892992.1 peptidoglycan/xylan/chitin deacetylase (PgdA/CDA1 family) [Kutzneria kofuensis]
MIRPLLAGAAAVLAAHALPAVLASAPLRQRIAPRLSGVGEQTRVALTIDDGPHPVATPRFLDVLAKQNVQATFFLLGQELVRNPQLGKEIVAAGHEIAVHGWEHRMLVLRGPLGTRDDITRAHDYIAEVTGVKPRWYRPPYGVLSTAAALTARRLGMTPVLWTSWGRDWEKRANPDFVYETVTKNLHGGGTVLLHDSDCTSVPGSWAATLGALPRILAECDHRGLKVGPLRSHQVN